MAALGWQRRLPQVYRMRHAGVQDTERARWGARGERGKRTEGPEVWAWRAWIEDAQRIPALTQPGGGAEREWAEPRPAWLGALQNKVPASAAAGATARMAPKWQGKAC